MATNIVTVEDLEILKKELIQVFESLLNQKMVSSPSKKWLKTYEVRKLLDISPGTIQNLRINGTLPYSKFGGAIYYDYDDIMKVMNENRIHNDFKR